MLCEVRSLGLSGISGTASVFLFSIVIAFGVVLSYRQSLA